MNVNACVPELPSDMLTSLMENEAPSSFNIVPTPVLSLIVIFLPAVLIALRTTLNVSFCSTFVSPLTTMEMVFDLSEPPVKVSVPPSPV